MTTFFIRHEHIMRYVLLCILALALAAPASAQFHGPGAPESAASVQAILDDPVDNQLVELSGRIIEQTGDEEYVFTDGEAEIRAEIEEEVFPQQEITPETTVVIYGEVEDDFLQDPEIDVERMTVVEQ